MFHKSNCLIAQSGGPTVAINASLAGIIEEALNSPQIDTIYGALNGILGVLDEKLINLSNTFSKDKEALDLLKNTPSMYLGSCRYKLPEAGDADSDYLEIFKIFQKYNIKYFFYIGGNDSMDTVSKLSKYAKKINFDISIIGIPKTIDNDLRHIDHTPGYGSAAKYISTSILEIAHDAYIYDIQSVIIVEIMGRNAGWLTAASALARNEYNTAPHLIYLPELPFSTEQFITDVQKELSTRKQVIVAVSEGIKDSTGEYISAKSGQVDQFGHVMLSGTGKYLENLVKEKIACKVRSIELNVLQRCATHISSLTDINESCMLGKTSVPLALEGCSGRMVLLRRESNSPYTVSYDSVSIDEIANKEKYVPVDWISESKNDITEEFMEYMRPLIQGEPKQSYKNGLPSYLSVNHLIHDSNQA
ncbi:6-phosphofructokinase [Anaeromicropila herbilytica]|uniref:Pyrophosphate--fructose 6-phosphate 1-phosphotransferase n=1 Tax=Anaeromicropila herbilytica TaxID=2785025 RepID=A0A7R7ICB8_9FIRM|nr:6-phosphofructokinase [Anaeromicropila herbilytica]BCN29706.1 pyrophosphate--fructose 6-phosphate 1-phosphotransferase [Anaeromicropila herbilytica]